MRPAAQRDEPGGVLQRQRAGHARGGDLALGVADHRVRGHAAGLATAAASETITTANSAGCTTSTRSSSAVLARQHVVAATSPRSGASASRALARTRSANTGAASSSSGAIPAHCEPWPGKTNDGGRRAATPVHDAGCGPGRRRARPGRRRHARPRGRGDDRRAVVHERRGSPASRRHRPGPVGTGPDVARAAAGLVAQRVVGRAPTAPRAPTAGRPRRARRPSSSAVAARRAPASRITWALVPLMPNEETPARRGRPVSGHGLRSVEQP